MHAVNIDLKGASVLVTGAAGFIGASLVATLLRTVPGIKVTGLDNLNEYYSVELKEHRLDEIQCIADESSQVEWRFEKGDIADPGVLERLCARERFDVIVHLAAQAGIRHSIVDPESYVQSNLVGFFRVLEACRAHAPRHLVYASSSSVYGAACEPPFSVDDATDAPLNLYAATKKSDELMAHAYANLYGIPTTGLRFFTVYGPAGRPDMAYFSFAEKLCAGEALQLFDGGRSERDYTYIDDAVEAVMRALERAPQGEPPYAIYNVGGHVPVRLEEFVDVLHEELVRAGALSEESVVDGRIELLPAQPGDMHVTCADTTALERDLGFVPSTPLREGLRRFAAWYGEQRA